MSVSCRGVLTGDWAIEHGKFEWSLIPIAGGSPKRDQGNFVVIWIASPTDRRESLATSGTAHSRCPVHGD